MASEYKFSQRVTLAIVPRIAALVVRVLTATMRFESLLEPGVTSVYDYPRPSIYVFWHRTLLACAGNYRDQNMAILISQSFDGELIARTVARLGFIPLRGSSSRGGAGGLKAMQQAYADGRLIAITADGPRGPKYVAKPGAVQLAQLAESPVRSFHVMPQHAWMLRSWDGFLIPKPFTRAVICYGAPVPYSKDTKAMQAGVQTALDRLVAMADAHWSNAK